MNTQSRAHRILKPLDAFSEQVASGESPEFKGDESLLGVYRNHAKSNGDRVVFTTAGVYVFRTLQGRWESAKYADIAGVETPGTKHCTELNLKLLDGTELILPIHGVRADRFYDSLEVLRFLDRVIADHKVDS